MQATDNWDPADDLAAFVSSLRYEDVPTSARETVERAFLDTVGVTLAGLEEGAGSRAVEALGSPDCRTGAPVVGMDVRTTPPEAAFLTGTAGHALDYDDYTYAYPMHPSVTIVPPILSLLGRSTVDGQAAITAYTAGFEALSVLTAPISSAHYERGWHATGAFGVFAAAAATASLLALDRAATREALNIAASTASGLRRNFGTDTKPMHAGQASRSGVTAALLADSGFTAESDAITGEDGFYDLYCGRDDLDYEAVSTPGEPLGVVNEGVNTKLYPSCGATHSTISAASKIARATEMEPEEIESITVEIAPFGEDALRYSTPKTGAEAKFSMEYCVAVSLCRDRVGLDAFEDGALDDSTVMELLQRVDVQYDQTLAYNDHRSTTTIITEDGTKHQEAVSHPPGTMENQLADDELRRKFRDCAMRRVSESTAADLYEGLATLRETDSLEAILAPALS